MSVDGISISVVNAKSVNERDKSLLQDALSLYNEELPSMVYAANTGKESRFLERCVTNGKYCTLLLQQQTSVGKSSVIAAITYQIIPADTQYAEIPLAAVQSAHQRKGLGTALYQELHMRLQDVGVLTTFCWGDQESESFWVKQGFSKIAEVDGRGRPQKLRLKADVRKAMCMPGSATLMVSRMKGTAIEKNMVHGATKLFSYAQSLHTGLLQLPPQSVEAIRGSPSFSITTPVPEAPKPALLVTPSERSYDRRTDPAAGKVSMNNLTPLNIAGALARVASKPFYDDAENLTPRIAEAGCASLHSTVKRTPSMCIYNVLEDVSNVSPKPGSQRFAALCDVASSLTNQAKDKSRRNSATSEEPHKCTFQLPELGCKLAQEKLEESHVYILPEVPGIKHTKEGMRTYKKRSIAPKDGAAQSPGVLITKGSEPDSIGLDQGTAADKAHPTGDVLDKGPETRTKKHRRVGGAQPSSNAAKKNNDGPVIARELRSSSSEERKCGLTVSGQRSNRLPVPLTKDGDIHDVPMAEASDSPCAIQKPDVSSLRECEASVACNGSGWEQLEMVSIGEGLDEGHPVCSRDEGVAVVKNTIVQETEADSDQNVGLANPAASDESARQNVLESTEITGATDVHVYTAGDPMSFSMDEGGDTELIASKHCSGTAFTGYKKVEYVVMFMNMSNETRRKHLTQFVEQLGGEVTGTGTDCTIVVTGEVRTTLNFCTALCAGAWVVSSDWLRESVRNKKFVDPALHILRDKTFEMKYEASVQEVVLRARQKPKSLFKGFLLYPTPNVYPNLETIVQLITSAGGKVLSNLQEALATGDPSRTIILACEEDTMEALEVSLRGMWVFSVDWFTSCIIRQDIDLGKPQFAEPLC